ncbi:TonB-dependent receptor domain-containing protein, partial [Gemmatimonadota bacterium]
MRRAFRETLPAWLGHTVMTMVLLLGLAIPASAQTGTVEGQVVDGASGEPVALAIVRVIGTNFGSETAADGRFVVLNVPTGTYSVQVRAIGYAMVTTQVRVGPGQPATVQFELQRSLIQLDAVVVTGTAGEARRRSVGNTISQINISEVAEPSVSVDALLQGRSAGVTVLQSSGMAGSGAQIRLRGNVSVSMSNQPLIYVDGVRIRSEGYPKNVPITGYSGYSGNDVASPLNDIDPADIERMEVIKGAAATTLYGTEASAGVIQIFTKKGRSGAARWTAQIDQGFNKTLPFGPPVDFMAVSPGGANYMPDVCPDDPSGRYGEFPCDPSYVFVQPWLRTAWRQKYALSAAGGGEALRYYVGGSFENNEGVMVLDVERKGSIRGNFDFTPMENLEVSWNTSFTKTDITNTPAGNNAQGITLNAYRRERNYMGTTHPDTLSLLLDFDIQTHLSRMITGVTARYAPTEYLMQRVTFGYDQAGSEMRSIRPFGSRAHPAGIVSDIRWQNTTVTADYLGTLTLDLSESVHNSFSWGGQAISSDEAQVTGYGENLPPGEMTVSSASVTLAGESRQKIQTGGFFVQDVLSLKDRYFLTLGMRGDYNSVFGQNIKGLLQVFPKASVSYVISDETFWPLALGQLKLRGAWGQAGRAPGTFDAVKTWDPVGWGGQMAFDPENIGNDSLGPERTTEWE